MSIRFRSLLRSVPRPLAAASAFLVVNSLYLAAFADPSLFY